MKVLFCHDGPINSDESNHFFSIGFNDKLFARYERVFGEVAIVTRVERNCKSYHYSEKDRLTIERYKLFEYPNFLTVKSFLKSKKNANLLLKEIIKEFDALIIRLPSFLGSTCVKIAKQLNKPYLIELVGCPWDSLRNHGLLGKCLAPYMYFLTRKQVKNATDVLYVTNSFLQKRYPTYGRQIACSDVELLIDNNFNIKRQLEKDFNPKNFVIGTLGQIALRYKGHETVIKAISLLKRKGISIQYQIAGPGDKSYLQSVAKKHNVLNNIVFIGPMNHDDVFKWFDNLDIYIQPSLTEGMPRALIEAMSRGCCCIASNAGGMPELLDEKFIFKKGNSMELTRIIDFITKELIDIEKKRNYEYSFLFNTCDLDMKRNAFYQKFFLNLTKGVK